ncbi:hypothetical protein BANRA_01056 [Acinetobacter baumannii]|nr:hypothetical protein BANRA_01056 [Acinetobacter baumannii]
MEKYTAHLGIKTFPVRTYMSCSWLFEDRTETWLTTSRSRIGNFPIINNRKGIQQYGWRLVKGMLQLKTAIHQFFKSKLCTRQISQNPYPIRVLPS